MCDMAGGVVIVSAITFDSLSIINIIVLTLINRRSTAWIPTHVPKFC